MKTLIFFLFLFFLPFPAHAGIYTLKWDPSPTPGITGYRAYQGQQGGPYRKIGEDIIAGTTQLVGVSAENGKCFVVTAFKKVGDVSYLESEYSNEACLLEPPTFLRIIIEGGTP